MIEAGASVTLLDGYRLSSVTSRFVPALDVRVPKQLNDEAARKLAEGYDGARAPELVIRNGRVAWFIPGCSERFLDASSGRIELGRRRCSD